MSIIRASDLYSVLFVHQTNHPTHTKTKTGKLEKKHKLILFFEMIHD